jgi:hypothetical protein
LGAPFFALGRGVSVGVGEGVSSELGVGDFFLCFRFVSGVGLGDGVGEIFFRLGDAVGDGLGVVFFVELFLCLCFGTGVGVAKIFLIFVPNDSSAASGVTIAAKQIVASRTLRRIILVAGKISGRAPEESLC